MYWVDNGQHPKIERSRLDGTDRKVIVQNGVNYPRGITVDIETNDVFWVDSVIDAIQVSTCYSIEKLIRVFCGNFAVPS